MAARAISACSATAASIPPSGALSVQPMFGGPVYFYQNLVYNAPTGSLKYIEGSSGILTYNNTIIGEGRAGPASNQQFRNNLILAQGAFDPVFAVTTYTNYSSSDYNGFRPNPGKADSFEWNSPAFGVAAAFGQTTVDAPLPEAGGLSRGNRPGTAQRVGRLRRLHARAEAGSQRSAARLHARWSRFQLAARLAGHRCRHRAADDHRWIHRPRAGSGSLRIRHGRRSTTVRASAKLLL